MDVAQRIWTFHVSTDKSNNAVRLAGAAIVVKCGTTLSVQVLGLRPADHDNIRLAY